MKEIIVPNIGSTKRKGCKDVFHAFMVEGATFDGYYDIPFIPQKGVVAFYG